jgi:ectoine hydroxylase-related dioxygenase (phytanoyl-CoA dioxygenase family)
LFTFIKKFINQNLALYRGSVKLNIQAETNVSTSSGLFYFKCHVDNLSHLNVYLLVKVCDQREIAKKIIGPLDNKIIGFHTHLLGIGAHNISFSLYLNNKLIDQITKNITIENSGGLFDKVQDALVKFDTPIIFEDACDSSMYPYENEDIRPWFDRPDADNYITKLLNNNSINEYESKCLKQFVEDGYMVLESLIDEDLIFSVNKEIDEAIEQKYQDYTKGSSQRIEHLHFHYPNINKLFMDHRYRRMIDVIFGVKARPCQTLTFVNGSQQPAHQDLIYLTPFPAGYMCGTWIALQDVYENSGELVVYPKSHRDKRIYMRDIGCKKNTSDSNEFNSTIYPMWAEVAKKYKPYIYRPKKGDVLIWHENLLHGGSKRINESLERRSVVIHSFAEGSISYYDSSGGVAYMEAVI